MDIIERVWRRFKAPCNRVVLEIGAHEGTDTMRIYSCFSGSVRYIAFEPDRRNILKLQQHQLVKHSKVELIPAAVSSKVGVAMFHMSGPDWSQSSSILKPTGHLEKYPWVGFPEQAPVETTSLDAIAKAIGIDYIDFIWMDVQGAEHLVFMGGSEILRKTAWIYTEFSDVPFYEGQTKLEALINLLPGEWEIVENYGEDVLLNNLTLCGKAS